MKNKAAAALNAMDLFNKLVGESSGSTRSAEVKRTVNGIEYFQSKYSGRFFPESDRAGKGHRYSKQDIGVWNKIYAALKPLKSQYDKLLAEGEVDMANAVFTDEHKILWNAKDSDPTLYANTGGLTAEELDALEK